MNEASDPSSFDDSMDVDLLVDGELDDDQRCEMLLRLEREPDGWRRCALAFLETQCWQQQLGDRVQKTDGAVYASDSQPGVATINQSTPYGWLRGHFGPILAVAASFLAAFSLGVMLDHFRGTSRDATVAQRPIDADNGMVSASDPSVEDPPSPGVTELVNDRSSPRSVSPDMISLVVQGTDPGGIQRIPLPVRDASELSDGWLLNQPSAVTPEMLEVLERTGHSIKQRRQLWPFQLDDGRQVVVPVDQVEVRRTDYGPYQ